MRSVKKQIEGYRKLIKDNDIFFASDFYNIAEYSKNNFWDCIANALMYGFMMGYRYGKKKNKSEV